MPLTESQKAAGIIGAALEDVILVPEGVNASLVAIINQGITSLSGTETEFYHHYSVSGDEIGLDLYLSALLSSGYITSQQDLSYALSKDWNVQANDSIAVTSFLFHEQTERMNLIVDELHKATEEIKDSVKTDVTVNIDSSTLGLDDLQGAIGAQYSNTLANMEALYGDIANAQAAQLDAQSAAFQSTLDAMNQTASDTATATAQSAQDLMTANSEQASGFMDGVIGTLSETYQDTVGAIVGIVSSEVSTIIQAVEDEMAKPLEYLSGLLSDLTAFFTDMFMDSFLDISNFFKSASGLFSFTDDDMKAFMVRSMNVQRAIYSDMAKAMQT